MLNRNCKKSKNDNKNNISYELTETKKITEHYPQNNRNDIPNKSFGFERNSIIMKNLIKFLSSILLLIVVGMVSASGKQVEAILLCVLLIVAILIPYLLYKHHKNEQPEETNTFFSQPYLGKESSEQTDDRPEPETEHQTSLSHEEPLSPDTDDGEESSAIVEKTDISENLSANSAEGYKRGELDEISYRNESLDLLFLLPDWWMFYTDEEIKNNLGLFTYETDADNYVEMAAYHTLTNERLILFAQKEPYKETTMDTYIAMLRVTFPPSSGFKRLSKSTRMIGEKLFERVSFGYQGQDSGGQTVYQTVYIYKQSNVFFTILSMSMDENSDVINNALDCFQSASKGILTQNLNENEYRISDIPAIITVDDKYKVYSITKKMCAAQGIALDKATTYVQGLKPSGTEMKIIPERGSTTPEFEIQVKVKTKDYGVDNLKDADENMFNSFKDRLLNEFSAHCDGEYEIFETETAKYIVFDMTMLSHEKRYVTVINGKLIYLMGISENAPITPEQNEDLKSIANSLKY